VSGLFETMLVVRGEVVQRDEHFARLAASAQALGFPPPSEDAFRAAVALAAKQVQSHDAALRCTYVQENEGWRLIATTAPIPETTLQRREGARAITLDLSRALPEHKTIPYEASVIGLQRARDAGANEGLFVDDRGHILEGTATNVFAITDTSLITAPISAGILPGIVRAWVLEHIDLAIIERAPTTAELREGGFVTSSLTLLAPLVELDGRACRKPGEAFEKLRRLYPAG
jgi:branched-chain amino acid aminotransferase